MVNGTALCIGTVLTGAGCYVGFLGLTRMAIPGGKLLSDASEADKYEATTCTLLSASGPTKRDCGKQGCIYECAYTMKSVASGTATFEAEGTASADRCSLFQCDAGCNANCNARVRNGQVVSLTFFTSAEDTAGGTMNLLGGIFVICIGLCLGS